MTRKKSIGCELGVFKGREGKLNLAIFLILALSDPLTIKELYKQLSIQKEFNELYYASLSKRLSSLVDEQYLKTSKVGRQAATYQLTNKAYLAMFLEPNSMQEIIDKASEKNRAFLLLALVNAVIEE